jgi:hypothetical protein
MKISIDVDCTPEEARRFLGLPNVGPMQAELMQAMQKRMMSGLEAMEPDQILKTWLPSGLKGWEEMQKAFWSQMAAGASGSGVKKKP